MMRGGPPALLDASQDDGLTKGIGRHLRYLLLSSLLLPSSSSLITPTWGSTGCTTKRALGEDAPDMAG
eukprot:CAMPEP_0204312708 /NCGR_PEP_ID=MMETSP0469-20131031/3137_1 /ASSEMBLY_ACC=CAM_ASM_000384 /TAXON_ID=2969 /ORGANISM="Oxyrrhis marina" /LENGTH=67 /DNA_ID=CAMNT_0051292875 /DNA_START=602 /DNA_END=802 /DNA_ORIENTATION=+